VEVTKLWNSLMLAYVPYIFTLIVFFLISFISYEIGRVLLSIGVVGSILNFYRFVRKLVLEDELRAMLVTIGALTFVYFVSNIYIFVMFA
jgi:hypothetical protein